MPKKTIDIPSDIVEYLRYEPDTGHLYWKVDRSSGTKAGDRAGCVGVKGYRFVTFKGKTYYAHRVAWFLHYGEQAPDPIDHENRDRDDNRATNLRDGRNGVQDYNRGEYTRQTDLPKYVHPNRNRFQALVSRKSKLNHVGIYDTPEEAHEAALSWITQYNETTE